LRSALPRDIASRGTCRSVRLYASRKATYLGRVRVGVRVKVGVRVEVRVRVTVTVRVRVKARVRVRVRVRASSGATHVVYAASLSVSRVSLATTPPALTFGSASLSSK